VIQRFKPKSAFSRNVLTLMTGTTIAQAIPIAISPILTRIYTPEDFGVLALYISLVSIFSVITTLRYELAIIQPRQNEDAAALVVLSAAITSGVSLALLIVVIMFNKKIQDALGNDEIGAWLYLFPVSVFLTGLYQSLNYWNTRKEQYRKIAYTKIFQGVSASGTQVGFGVGGVAGGLLWGYFSGQVAALLLFLPSMFKGDKEAFLKVTVVGILKNARRYKKYPKYSTLGAFADSASLQMPILILSKFFDVGVTGMFSLTFRVLNLPMALMSKAISQVLFQNITRLHNEPGSSPQAHRIVIKLFSVLLAMMVPFVVFIGLFGEGLFAYVFGEPWREAGSLAAVLVVAVAIRFAVSPLSSVLAMDHNIKLGVLWQFIYLVTITTTLYLFRSEDIKIFVVVFVVHEVVLYLLYLAFIVKGAKYVEKV
jgi:O-antigen/teichoic acid export membrane protein